MPGVRERLSAGWLAKGWLLLSFVVAGAAVGIASEAQAQAREWTHPNPFDYQGANLPKGDGTEASPFLIYNVEQLQAIEGTVAFEVGQRLQSLGYGDSVRQASVLFGTNRLRAHYRLANDIDATATRGWNNGKGYDPIGEYINLFARSRFFGVFNGDGYEVRGLWVNRPNRNDTGLFGSIGSGSSVVSVGVADGYIRGYDYVGGLVGWSAGEISFSWSSSAVAGGRLGDYVGGLVGRVSGGNISSSWSSGAVWGRVSIGGLVGSLAGRGNVSLSWSSSAVLGRRVAGLVGNIIVGNVSSSWSSGSIDVDQTGEFISGLTNQSFIGTVSNSYWSIETSGWGDSDAGIGVNSLQTISVSSWADAWHFGGEEDFPVLISQDSDLQAAGVANGLTRVFGIGGVKTTLDIFAVTTTIGLGGHFFTLFLDTNAKADDFPGDPDVTSTPTCSIEGGFLTAETNYNDATVRMLTAADRAVFAAHDSLDCAVEFYPLAAGLMTLRVESSSGGATLTRDYLLHIMQNAVPPPNEESPSAVVLSPPFVVPANASAGEAVLTIAATDAGAARVGAKIGYALESSSFAIEGGGGFATVFLRSAATAIFDSDGKEEVLTISLVDNQFPTVRRTTLTITLRSALRAIDSESVLMAVARAREASSESGARLFGFGRGDLRLSFWHYEGELEYEIAASENRIAIRDDGFYFHDNSIAGATTVSFAVILRATDSDSVVEARRSIVLIVRGDDEKWTPFDPFDYEEAILPQGGGSAESPYLIYNVEQLQAIDGVIAPEVRRRLRSIDYGNIGGRARFLFGDNRLRAHYRLANNIDATSTREWNGGKGFDPIGDYIHFDESSFSGVFNGGGYDIRGLQANRPNEDDIGLFGNIGSGASIVGARIVDGRFTGDDYVGGLAGWSDGNISSSWSSSEVSGSDYVGGLVGDVYGGSVSFSWSSGAVSGEERVGGLVGEVNGDISSSWSSGAVSGEERVGGLVGNMDGDISSSWSSGAVAGRNDVGGLVGKVSGGSATGDYWSVETSGREDSVSGIGVDSLQTISVASWSASGWRFGGARDFPALASEDAADSQSAGIAAGLTRVLGIGGATAALDIFATATTIALGGPFLTLLLDVNAEADDLAGDPDITSTPICSIEGGFLTAATNYNGATVRMLAAADKAIFVAHDSRACAVEFYPLAAGLMTLQVESSAGGATLTRDYLLHIMQNAVPPNEENPSVTLPSPPFVVSADAQRGAAVLTIAATDAGAARMEAEIGYALESSLFAIEGGGGFATVFLRTAATAIFDADGKEAVLTIVVADNQPPAARRTILTITLRSSPRALDAAVVLTAVASAREASSEEGARLFGFAQTDLRASLWHYEGDAEYAVAAVDNRIAVRDERFYFHDNSIAGAATVSFAVVLRATLSDSVVEARQTIVLILRGGDEEWGASLDRFDYEGAGLPKGDGGEESPYLIYNVEQLQAIDGVVAAHVWRRFRRLRGISSHPNLIRRASALFGNNRLNAHYRLANNIDATETRYWNGERGFDPIGDIGGQNRKSFTGVFDGGGYAVRGLRIRRPDQNDVGVFGSIDSGASIMSVGFADGKVAGGAHVGGLVGWMRGGEISSSWSSGAVEGTRFVGGLSGWAEGGSVSSSWSSGAVLGGRHVGGLVGEAPAKISSSWSSAAVLGDSYVGGLAGRGSGNISSSWSSGAVASNPFSGGFIGAVYNDGSVSDSYWSVETSGLDDSEAAIGVDSLQTVSAASWSADDWRFGGGQDFPALVALDADWQAAGVAAGMTRILGIGGATATLDIFAIVTMAKDSPFSALLLDTNAAADDLAADSDNTSTPTCSFANGVLTAATNYNGATVRMFIEGRDQAAVLAAHHLRDCAVYLRPLAADTNVALRVESSAGGATLTRIYLLRVTESALGNYESPSVTAVSSAVSAHAQEGDAVLTLAATDAGAARAGVEIGYALESPSFAIESGGGGFATVFLRTAATAIFDADGKEAVLTIVVSDNQQPTARSAVLTITLRSSPRAIDAPVVLAAARARDASSAAGARVFGFEKEDLKASFWHYEGEVEYAIATDDNRIAMRGDRIYFRDNSAAAAAAAGAATASFVLVLRATSSEPIVEARRSVALILRGDDERWASSDPFGYEEAGLPKGDGSRASPYLIYNVEQLQAMDGTAAPEVLRRLRDLGRAYSIEQASVLFGENRDARIGAHYRLMNDIDATATREWNGGEGFDPIDGYFAGVFDGGGYAVRGLWVERPNESHIGLFGETGSGGLVMSVEVVDAHVRGDSHVGAVVGLSHGRILSSWSSGAVLGVGNVGGLVGYSLEDISSSWSFSKVSGREYVGGLAGYVENGDISSSWASGAVSGISNVGGLAGYLWKGNASSSWSSGAVSGRWYVGGLVAFVREGSVSSSWSSGAVGGYYNVGGLVSGQPSAVDSYWGVESSGRESSTSTSGIGVDSMQTLSVSSWDADVWRFGGETDFPALVSMDADLQAAGVAAGLTRVLGINGSTRALNIFAVSKIATDDPFAVLLLDTNAAAADLEADPDITSTPTCSFADGVLTAATNYNGATVRMFVEERDILTARDGRDCAVRLHPTVAGLATLRVESSVGGATLTSAYLLDITESALNAENPSASVLPSSFVVAADLAAGEAVLTIAATDAGAAAEGAEIDYVVESATAFAIESGGGGRATVFVRTAAAAIFDADDKKEVLTILVSDNQSPLARRAALTITLRSSPRAVNAASVLEATLDATDASSATEARLFGREDVRASLWHYEGEAEYALDAGVYHDRIALESDGVYFRDDLIVRSATMFFTVILRALSSDAALTARQAVALIVNGNDQAWTHPDPFDYDGARFTKGDGSEESPYLIYNIEQLQAIAEGAIAPEVLRRLRDLGHQNSAARASVLFGENGLRAQYRLANNIDATATREWNGGRGFDPIGDSDNQFAGVFDGQGYAALGLHVDTAENDAGLFGAVGAGATIRRVGVKDGRFRGGARVGGLAGSLAGMIIESWSESSVVGLSAVGGLVGRSDGGTVARSWSAGDVVKKEGAETGFGGLVGRQESDGGAIVDSWSSASVRGGGKVGGLVGEQEREQSITRSWSLGRVAGDSGDAEGVVGDADRRSEQFVSGVYWDIRNSMQTLSGFNRDIAVGVDTMRTVTVAGWSAWDFGGDDNFPILTALDSRPQAAAIAGGLTRLVSLHSQDGEDGLTLSFAASVTLSTAGGEIYLRLDFGYGADYCRPAGVVAQPTESGVVMEVEAANGVTVRLRTNEGSSGQMMRIAGGGCKLRIFGRPAGGAPSPLELRIESEDESFVVSREYTIEWD